MSSPQCNRRTIVIDPSQDRVGDVLFDLTDKSQRRRIRGNRQETLARALDSLVDRKAVTKDVDEAGVITFCLKLKASSQSSNPRPVAIRRAQPTRLQLAR